MKNIYVTQNELTEFLTTSKRKNRIRAFWKYILKNMPAPIYNNIKKTPTKLKQITNNNKIKGAIAYQFIPETHIQKTYNYLQQYLVIVEKKLPEKEKSAWKQRMKKLTLEIAIENGVGQA